MLIVLFILHVAQELEKLASRKLRIGAKETMKIAEKLYTQGYISYPRTETNMFPKDFDLRTLVSHQTQDPNWGGQVMWLCFNGFGLAWWLSGRFGALRSEGRRFESRSSRHVGTLGRSFTRSCL